VLRTQFSAQVGYGKIFGPDFDDRIIAFNAFSHPGVVVMFAVPFRDISRIVKNSDPGVTKYLEWKDWAGAQGRIFRSEPRTKLRFDLMFVHFRPVRPFTKSYLHRSSHGQRFLARNEDRRTEVFEFSRRPFSQAMLPGIANVAHTRTVVYGSLDRPKFASDHDVPGLPYMKRMLPVLDRYRHKPIFLDTTGVVVQVRMRLVSMRACY